MSRLLSYSCWLDSQRVEEHLRSSHSSTLSISLNLHSLQHQRLARMRHTARPNIQLRMPLLRISRHLNVEIENHPCKDHLDLIGSEEAARTCVPSITKGEIRLVGGYELVTGVISCRTALTQLVMSEPVEDVAFWVVSGVSVDGG
jgi:hypothetical protein